MLIVVCWELSFWAWGCLAPLRGLWLSLVVPVFQVTGPFFTVSANGGFEVGE